MMLKKTLFSLVFLLCVFGSSVSLKCYTYFSTVSAPAANYSETIECVNGDNTGAACTNLIFTYNNGKNSITTYLAGCEQVFRGYTNSYCDQQRGNTDPGFEILSCNACRAEDLCNKFEDIDPGTPTATPAHDSAIRNILSVVLVFMGIFLTRL